MTRKFYTTFKLLPPKQPLMALHQTRSPLISSVQNGLGVSYSIKSVHLTVNATSLLES